MSPTQRAAAVASLIQRRGDDFTLTGTSTPLKCISDDIQSSDLDYLPDGARNGANEDRCVVLFAPSVGIGVVVEGATGKWSLTGETYTVAHANAAQNGMIWRCIVYRSPAPGTSTKDSDQDAVWAYVAPGS